MLLTNARTRMTQFDEALELLTRKTLGAATAWEMAALTKKLSEQRDKCTNVIADLYRKHGAVEVRRGQLGFPKDEKTGKAVEPPEEFWKEMQEILQQGDEYNPVVLPRMRNNVELGYEPIIFVELEGLVKLA